MQEKTPITVETTVNVPLEKAWKIWNDPKDIMAWSHASEDWHTPHAENDLRVGGAFLMRMAAKDGSVSFDFVGKYTNVNEPEVIEYLIEDGRKVKVVFEREGEATKVIETFDPENENPPEMQKGGWQAILDNFKKHAEMLMK